jgi:transposase
MPQIIGQDRNQLMMLNLAEQIPEDSVVRVIDAFINAVDLEDLGFIVKGKSIEGRPAYTPDTLTKLYLYGYLHSIRSSRKLQRECSRNIELWL